jgi:outer membrane lipoprotein-sorting protein
MSAKVVHAVQAVFVASIMLTHGYAADTNSILDGWFAAQAKVRTWSADFTQTRSLKVLTHPLLATGKVYVAIPDRFRWELGEPAQTIALRQPDQLWVIYPRLQRAEKYPLNNQPSASWKDALSLLEASFPRHRAELESHFHILSLAQTNSEFQIGLEPKNSAARQMLREIQVGFRTNDFSLTSTEMVFSDGSRLRNDFAHAVLNPVLPGDCFEFRPGTNYTIVEPLKR